ncbi:uncharacterized protein LOC144917714 [Branchiostoma floridae x Branchiostoma belcheri]
MSSSFDTAIPDMSAVEILITVCHFVITVRSGSRIRIPTPIPSESRIRIPTPRHDPVYLNVNDNVIDEGPTPVLRGTGFRQLESYSRREPLDRKEGLSKKVTFIYTYQLTAFEK